MSSITPTPPGTSVQFLDAATTRFLPPGCQNLFCVGFFDRGSTAQGSGVVAITDKFGPQVPYSTAHQALVTAVAESGAATTWTAARVVGPEAVKATATLDSLTITAKTAGAWANGATGGLSAQVTADDTDRRLTVFLDGEAVAATAFTADVADLTSVFTAAQDYVTVTGSTLPTAGSATDLAGGDDDRSDADETDWAAALATLDERYGPGLLIAPGETDEAIQAEILEHCAEYNRHAFLDLPAGVSKNDALTHVSAVRALASDEALQRVVWIASWGYVTPVAGGGEQLVPYSAIHAGITSRLIRDGGVQAVPFGPENATSNLLVAGKLHTEWSTADRADLYAAGICVASDNGRGVAMWGYKSGSEDAIDQDAWQQQVRMGLRFDLNLDAERYIGRPITPATIASLEGTLTGTLQGYVDGQALRDFIVDTSSVNTEETAAARELHAHVRIRHIYSSDWVAIPISVSI